MHANEKGKRPAFGSNGIVVKGVRKPAGGLFGVVPGGAVGPMDDVAGGLRALHAGPGSLCLGRPSGEAFSPSPFD